MFRDWFILLVFRTFLARRLKRSSPSVLLNLLYCRLSSILIFSSGSFLTVARSTVLLLLLTILWEELVMWTLRIQFLWWKILFFWRSPRLMERLVLRLLIRWAIQRGTICIPKSTNPGRIEANSKIFDFELTEEEMKEIRSMDKRHRYCTGYIFLPSPQTWEDVWDGENID